MKLETKYGVLEGTVEEFRELLEGEKDLSFFSKEAEDKSGYYIVNKDDVVCFLDFNKKLPKGLVLKHIVEDRYEDTLGKQYVVYDKYLDDFNKSWVDGGFKSFKKDDKLLVAKY